MQKLYVSTAAVRKQGAEKTCLEGNKNAAKALFFTADKRNSSVYP
jgi:hypothetical protein